MDEGLLSIGAVPDKVLVLDDDPDILEALARFLSREGWHPHTFSAPEALLAALVAPHPDASLVLTDLEMPRMNGLEIVRAVRELRPRLPVILMTGEGSVTTAVEAMKLGAYDYLIKPFQPFDVLAAAVRRALGYRHLVERNRTLESILPDARARSIVGGSRPMREVDSLIDRVADVDTTVLVLGESGTGKEMVARAIHERSGRSAGRFVAINCGALAESVLESELFGHVRGAFTGAVSAHRGLFEEASGSTLFLDEVGELPLATQVKLLRVLQEREIRPVGASESRRVDVRVVGATYRDLAREVERGTFREDLYYRLNVISIMVPPLRERPEDIPALVQHFIKTHARRMGRAVERIERDALELLLRYSWPGNVRELENVIERAIVLARTATIEAVLLPDLVRVQRLDRDSELPDLTDMPLAQAKDAFEHAYLERALARAGGRVADAARTAGLDPSNLRRVLRRHAIDPADFKGPTS